MARRENWASPDEIARLQGVARTREKRRRARPEDLFTSRVKRYAQRGNWIVYHTLRSKGSDPGLPDLIMIRLPRVVIAELKIPPNVTTAWQEIYLSLFSMMALLAGPWLQIEVYTWTPEDWPEIERVLD